jgi:hypothetical protein
VPDARRELKAILEAIVVVVVCELASPGKAGISKFACPIISHASRSHLGSITITS